MFLRISNLCIELSQIQFVLFAFADILIRHLALLVKESPTHSLPSLQFRQLYLNWMFRQNRTITYAISQFRRYYPDRRPKLLLCEVREI